MIRRKINPGQVLLTPGRGIPPTRQRPFFVTNITSNYIDIQIGEAQTFNRLPMQMFDAVEDFFRNNSTGRLRIAAEHTMTSTPGSVDEIVRSAVDFPRVIGNYVASILEAAGCVRYAMAGNRKYIQI